MISLTIKPPPTCTVDERARHGLHRQQSKNHEAIKESQIRINMERCFGPTFAWRLQPKRRSNPRS
jgi:hypothetical protein